jgi:ABC-type multidrug transport system fused ATPase/permease subunit
LVHVLRSTGDTIRRVTSDCGRINAIVEDALLPMKAATGSVRSVVELLQADQQPPDRTDAINLTHARGDVFIDSMSFACDAPREVLRQVALRAAPGEAVAIVAGPPAAAPREAQ